MLSKFIWPFYLKDLLVSQGINSLENTTSEYFSLRHLHLKSSLQLIR